MSQVTQKSSTATVDSFGKALGRAWQRRFDFERMGELAAGRIRTIIPADPIQVFLRGLWRLSEAINSEVVFVSSTIIGLMKHSLVKRQKLGVLGWQVNQGD